jgi:hypothetical protein
MGNGPSQASGTKLYIGTTAADALTDTFTLVGSLNSIGEYGPQFADVTFEDLSTGLIEHFKGARDDGTVQVGLGKDMNDAGQLAVRAALLVDDKYNFKIEDADSAPVETKTVTFATGAPGVVTWADHNFTAGTKVKFSTTGVLPSGIVAGTTYFVVDPDTDEFSLAATAGGSAITLAASPAQSGVHTGETIPTNTADYFKAAVQSFRKNVGNLQSVVMATVGLLLKSGTLETVARLPAPYPIEEE